MDKLYASVKQDASLRGRLLFASGLCLLLALGCSFQKPSAPSWDVDVTIPLLSKQYTMSEIADDQDALVEDSTGTLSFEQTSELDRYLVGDQLDMEDQTSSFSLEMGSFVVDSPGAEFTSVQLREIYSEADALQGQTAVIPNFNFETDKKPLDSYDEFNYVVIDSGSINVQVNNNLAITLGSPITIEVWDSNMDTLMLTMNKNIQITPGSSETFSKDLAGIRLPNQISIRMTGFSSGSDGQAVTIDADSRYEMAGEISELKASEAFAKIPEQRISRTDGTTITDSLVVSDALVQSGAVNLNISGAIPLDTWLIYELPDFYDDNNSTFSDSIFIAQGGQVNRNIDLTGLRLRPQPADFSTQSVRFQWRIRTVDTGDNLALVRATDVVNSEFSLTNLRFLSITGKMGKQKIDISQDDIEFDIPADLDSIFFETAQMELQIQNGINFPARLTFSIEGENKNGQISHLNIDRTIEPALEPGQPVTTTIVLNNQNSSITDFIRILPNLVRIEGSVELGDENWVGTVSQEDFVQGEVRISAPLSVRLPEQKIDSDPNEMDISDDVKDDIINNLANGSFFAVISNHLPLGADVEVVFGEDDSTMFDNPTLAIGPLRADAGLLDNAGYVSNPEQSEISFTLSEEDMRTFLRDRLYSGVRVNIDGTGGNYIKLRGSDFIEIKAYCQIKVKVNQD